MRSETVVEADLRVREVVVVEQHEVGAREPVELGHLGEVAVDVELDVGARATSASPWVL